MSPVRMPEVLLVFMSLWVSSDWLPPHLYATALKKTQFTLEPDPTRVGVVVKWARYTRGVELPGLIKKDLFMEPWLGTRGRFAGADSMPVKCLRLSTCASR